MYVVARCGRCGGLRCAVCACMCVLVRVQGAGWVGGCVCVCVRVCAGLCVCAGDPPEHVLVGPNNAFPFLLVLARSGSSGPRAILAIARRVCIGVRGAGGLGAPARGALTLRGGARGGELSGDCAGWFLAPSRALAELEAPRAPYSPIKIARGNSAREGSSTRARWLRDGQRRFHFARNMTPSCAIVLPVCTQMKL